MGKDQKGKQMRVEREAYTIDFAAEMADAFFRFEMESKGYCYACRVEMANGNSYHLNFYDPMRFYQDACDEMRDYGGYFYEENVVLVSKVTMDNMVAAIDDLYATGRFANMVLYTGNGEFHEDLRAN